MILLQDK